MASSSFPLFQNTTNLNFQNSLMMMNFGGGRTMLPDVNEMKPRLPVWLHHYPNNPIENPTINSLFQGSSSSNDNNGGILPLETVQTWLSGSQETVETYTEVPQGLSLKEEEEDNFNNNKGRIELNQLYTYDGCLNTPPPPPPPHMSATAVLQTASQMGSSRSTNSGGFEVMNTSHDEVSGFSCLNQTRNDGRSNLIGDDQMLNGDELMMMTMTAALKQKTGEGNWTRDFLGVEEKERRSFSLEQELLNSLAP